MPGKFQAAQAAIAELIAEKGLPREVMTETVGHALLDVYRRTVPNADNVTITVDPRGEVHMLVARRVVAQVANPAAEISLAEAQLLRQHAALGEIMPVEAPELLERIPVHAAGQLLRQRLREAEQTYIIEAFKDRVDEIVFGTIMHRENDGSYTMNLGKLEGVLAEKDQVKTERYRVDQRLHVYVMDIKRSGGRAPIVAVSRAHPNLLKRLFEQEVPEIMDGTVELKALVREAGSRSKVAVWARQEGIDPIGACVGMRGGRINNIVNELNGEKIDIIPWHPDVATFVGNALSPAKPLRVELREADHTAVITVPERQLSLAIGKEGQNARLAARLTGWRIDVTKPGADDPLADVAEAEVTSRRSDGAAKGR